MALIHMSTRGGRPEGMDRLRAALCESPFAEAPQPPVTILLHGLKFSPFAEPERDPRRHIYALYCQSHDSKAVSWPRHLGFRGRSEAEGLCIALGWDARGGLKQSYGAAVGVGRSVANIVRLVHAQTGLRPHLFAHSLGARVALAALRSLEEPMVGRVILQAGAEYQSVARRSLATPAGRGAEIVNVVSRQNDLFDALFELAIRPREKGAYFTDRALGAGLKDAGPNWLDLQLDHADVLARLAAMGFRIAPPKLRVCHWSTYLRPGAFALYRALLRDGLPLASLPRLTPERRWTRMVSTLRS